MRGARSPVSWGGPTALGLGLGLGSDRGGPALADCGGWPATGGRPTGGRTLDLQPAARALATCYAATAPLSPDQQPGPGWPARALILLDSFWLVATSQHPDDSLGATTDLQAPGARAGHGAASVISQVLIPLGPCPPLDCINAPRCMAVVVVVVVACYS